jgi:hypothetical protein
MSREQANEYAAKALDASFDDGVMWCLRILHADYNLDSETIQQFKEDWRAR